MSKKYGFLKFFIGAALAAGTAYVVKKAVDEGEIGQNDPASFGRWKEVDTGSVWEFGPNELMEVNGKVCRYSAKKNSMTLKEAEDKEDMHYQYHFDGSDLIINDPMSGGEMRFVLDTAEIG